MFCGLRERPRHAKVSHLQAVRLLARDQDVLRLEVTVDDAVGVQKMNASHQLQLEIAYHLRLQSAAGALDGCDAEPSHMLFQILIDKLEDQMYSPKSAIDVEQTHNVWMLRTPQHCHLTNRRAWHTLLLVNRLHLLHSHDPVRRGVPALVDGSIGALSDSNLIQHVLPFEASFLSAGLGSLVISLGCHREDAQRA